MALDMCLHTDALETFWNIWLPYYHEVFLLVDLLTC